MLNSSSSISGLFSSLIERVVSMGAGSSSNPSQVTGSVVVPPGDGALSMELFNFLYDRVFELLEDSSALKGQGMDGLFSFFERNSVPDMVMDKGAFSKGLWFLPQKDGDVDVLKALYSILSDKAGRKGGVISSGHRQLLSRFMEMVLALRIYALDLAREGVLFSLIPFIMDGRPFLVGVRFYGKRTRLYRKKKRIRFVCEFFASVFGLVRLVLDMDESRDFKWVNIYAQRNFALLKRDRDGIESLAGELNAVINIRPLNVSGQGDEGVLNKRA